MKLDIIGDIHGCYQELYDLTVKLGYSWESGLPFHPDGRKLAFVGDLTDRGPESLKVVDVVYRLAVEQNNAFYVPGNHCNKLYRFFLGRNVQITHGLETTVAEYGSLSVREQKKVNKMFRDLYESAPLYRILDNRKLIIAHAGIRADFIGNTSSKVKTFVLYGDITGATNPDGTPERRDWALAYKGNTWVVYGHTPVKEPRKINNTYNIDTGCVFGGKLTALRYPEFEIADVPSSMPFVPEKFRSFEEK
ncbi:bis(5'-nucleosyl)-tetraphosphatase PrpE [Peribacillus saganii]|uniref:Bis(5'-nucleosyl)-tetraphosphatase PrpE [asymmetrical] n=1 Tax=Peribacillus saganii TaxID=2303992 RepID=A0A372LMA4_9BACI|nr:bis(5'-nucleosyl)-tetraphosphatase PrpE [Peribacillus saganii]RFU68008.1 bis(5'-nucleosyl)-tetraphosphatase PrpE [Peribacillus saganii]